ncbi:MAG: site-specific integrase [Bacteroidota bacterium]
MPVAKITNLQAMQYMDKRLKADRIGARTYNNQLNYLRGGWTILEQRGYVAINIWKSIPIKKAPAKKRRAFTPYEAQTVIKRVREQDELLFYALLLQYCCFIRPKELSRLRRRHVDLQRGIVEVPGREAKSHEERFPSIPRSFLSYFDAQFWDRIQPNEIVFSKGWVAGGTSSCGRNQMNNRHRRVLEDLLEEGALDNIEGLSWYSWKDTGISEALEQLPLIIVQDQAGHTSPDMTLKYRTKRGRNERFGNEFENKLL